MVPQPPAEPLHHSLVLRLAAPLQSWGGQSEFNRRDTQAEPTKGGILGLLAAAQGRRRSDPMEDLLDLRLAVRTDQPGTQLRDYHTASDHRGRPLPSSQVTAKGIQKPTSPAKKTYVTHRYYLQDAAFVAAVSGPEPVLNALAAALRAPAFPLALGRRSCPPTHPVLLPPTLPETTRADQALWTGGPEQVLERVSWQASQATKNSLRAEARRRKRSIPTVIELPVTADLASDADFGGTVAGEYDVRTDLPTSFDPLHRGFTSRRVRQLWARHVPTGLVDGATTTVQAPAHDPFALLGW